MPRSGFTLIELVIVIVVIVAIAFIAIPRFGDTREQAHIAAMQADLSELRGAMDACQEEEGTFESCSEGLVQETAGVTLQVVERTRDRWTATAEHTATETTCVFDSGEGVIECNGAVTTPAD